MPQIPDEVTARLTTARAALMQAAADAAEAARLVRFGFGSGEAHSITNKIREVRDDVDMLLESIRLENGRRPD